MVGMSKRALRIKPNFSSVKLSARQSMTLLVVSIVFLVGALAAWYQLYYTRPSVVFWGAFDNALNTPGVLKQTTITAADNSTDVTAAMRFEDVPAVQLRTVLKQMVPSADGASKESQATAESIGIADGDFQRYIQTPTEVDTPEQQVIFDKIVGKWVQTGQPTQGRPNQIYIDGLFSAIPFGDLNGRQRNAMLNFARNGSDNREPILTVDYNAVKKTWQNMRPVYSFDATIDASSYAKWYQQYLSFMGFDEFAQPKYTDAVGQVLGLSEKAVFTIEVDAWSHTLVRVTRSNEAQGSKIVEEIKAIGFAPDIQAPAEHISREEFQAIIAGDSNQQPESGQ